MKVAETPGIWNIQMWLNGILFDWPSAGYGACLLDRPSKDLLDAHRAAKRLPGENFDETKQCEFVFGNGSKICPYMVTLYISPTSNLFLFFLSFILFFFLVFSLYFPLNFKTNKIKQNTITIINVIKAINLSIQLFFHLITAILSRGNAYLLLTVYG